MRELRRGHPSAGAASTEETGEDSSARSGPSRTRLSRLFPLPQASSSPLDSGPLSRRSSQRRSRKARINEDVDEAVMALNWLHDGKFHSPSMEPNANQQATIVRTQLLAKHAGGCHSCSGLPPTPEAALSTLLQGRDDYHVPSSPVSLAPFNLELISLPVSLDGAPRAEDLLDENDRRYLEVQERMMRPEPPDIHIEPYSDPCLKSNKTQYRRLIQHLNDIATWCSRSPLSIMQAFSLSGRVTGRR